MSHEARRILDGSAMNESGVSLGRTARAAL